MKAFVEPFKEDSQFREQMGALPSGLDRINSMVRSHTTPAAEQQRQQVDAVISLRLIGYSISPHIELELKADEGLVIEANPSQLRQIMINLILNAAEAMQDRIIGSSQQRRLRLQVRAFAEGDEVVITVRDEGCGMSAFQLERACEPYFTTKPECTGLGLAVSKQYGGKRRTLSIASKEGKFTEVTIRFKRCEA